MKKQILSIALGLVTMAIGTTTYAADKNPVSDTRFTVSEKAVNNSISPFISLPTDGLTVHSEIDGNKVTSAYDKNGNWLYTIERHTAISLLKDIMDIVKDSYNNYSITGMEKVDRPGHNTVYVVHIEDRNSIKTLRVRNGDVELIQDFQKG